MPADKRVLLAAIELFPLLAPYQLIIRPDWQDYLNIFFFFVAAISVGAMTVSALFAWAAVAGLNQRLRFDRLHGQMLYTAGAPIVRRQVTRCPLVDVSRLESEKHDWSDGAPSYSFVTHMVDGKTFKAGSAWSCEEIDRMVTRASTFLGLPRQTSRPNPTGGIK